MHDRLGGRSMCLFRASFPENQASLISLLFFLGSFVIIVVLSRSKLCPLLEVCAASEERFVDSHF